MQNLYGDKRVADTTGSATPCTAWRQVSEAPTVMCIATQVALLAAQGTRSAGEPSAAQALRAPWVLAAPRTNVITSSRPGF